MNADPQEPQTLKMDHSGVQVKMTDVVTAVPVKGCGESKKKKKKDDHD